MEKQDIINYVMHTVHNTNPAVLAGMLKQFETENTKSALKLITFESNYTFNSDGEKVYEEIPDSGLTTDWALDKCSLTPDELRGAFSKEQLDDAYARNIEGLETPIFETYMEEGYRAIFNGDNITPISYTEDGGTTFNASAIIINTWSWEDGSYTVLGINCTHTVGGITLQDFYIATVEPDTPEEDSLLMMLKR